MTHYPDTFDNDFIIEQLKTYKCKLVFTKRNGLRREMICTLNQVHIPTVQAETKGKEKNPDVQAVYDLEANDWRSFRWDSIKNFEVIE